MILLLLLHFPSFLRLKIFLPLQLLLHLIPLLLLLPLQCLSCCIFFKTENERMWGSSHGVVSPIRQSWKASRSLLLSSGGPSAHETLLLEWSLSLCQRTWQWCQMVTCKKRWQDAPICQLNPSSIMLRSVAWPSESGQKKFLSLGHPQSFLAWQKGPTGQKGLRVLCSGLTQQISRLKGRTLSTRISQSGLISCVLLAGMGSLLRSERPIPVGVSSLPSYCGWWRYPHLQHKCPWCPFPHLEMIGDNHFRKAAPEEVDSPHQLHHSSKAQDGWWEEDPSESDTRGGGVE